MLHEPDAARNALQASFLSPAYLGALYVLDADPEKCLQTERQRAKLAWIHATALEGTKCPPPVLPTCINLFVRAEFECLGGAGEYLDMRTHGVAIFSGYGTTLTTLPSHAIQLVPTMGDDYAFLLSHMHTVQADSAIVGKFIAKDADWWDIVEVFRRFGDIRIIFLDQIKAMVEDSHAEDIAAVLSGAGYSLPVQD